MSGAHDPRSVVGRLRRARRTFLNPTVVRARCRWNASPAECQRDEPEQHAPKGTVHAGMLMYVHNSATPRMVRNRPRISNTASIATRPKRILRSNAKLTSAPIATHTVLAMNMSATVFSNARCVVGSVAMKR